LLEPRDPLAIESLLTLIMTIWLDVSEDFSVKAWFVNFVYLKATLLFKPEHCVLCDGHGSTKESSSEHTPIKFISPCAIATVNAVRTQPFSFYGKHMVSA
jgi:hypothetical protein